MICAPVGWWEGVASEEAAGREGGRAEPGKGCPTGETRELARAERAAALEDARRRWQQAPPRASLDEIVDAVDAALGPGRARAITDLAASKEAGLGAERTGAARGARWQRRGRRGREVLVPGAAKPVRLERDYLVCSSRGASLFLPRQAFSPLDEARGLVPGSLNPRLLEGVARLGSRQPP